MRRGRIALALLGIPVLIAACSNGDAAANDACTRVHRSIAIYDAAMKETDPAVRDQQLARAQVELRNALPWAARAASENDQWQGLMTTLSLSNSVPEGGLIPALESQCAALTHAPAPTTTSLTIPPPPPQAYRSTG